VNINTTITPITNNPTISIDDPLLQEKCIESLAVLDKGVVASQKLAVINSANLTDNFIGEQLEIDDLHSDGGLILEDVAQYQEIIDAVVSETKPRKRKKIYVDLNTSFNIREYIFFNHHNLGK
jgi:hypothetical protein